MNKRAGLAAIFMAAILLIAERSGAQGPAPSCPPPRPGESMAGKMCVLLRVQNGRLLAPAANLSFWFPPTFAGSLSPHLSLEQVQASVKGQLDKILAGMPMPYVTALAPGESDPSLTDSLTNALRTFADGSIADYAAAMQPWSDANPNRKRPEDVLVDTSDFFAPMTQPHASSAITFDQPPRLDRSLAIFRFPDPFQSSKVQILLPASTLAQQQRIRDLRRVLAPLDGTLWDDAAIQKRIHDYYNRLGLAAQVILPAIATTNQLTVQEPARIAHVILMDPDIGEHDVDKVLWIVLTQHDFNTAMKHRPSVKDGERLLDYAADLGYASGDEPYVLASRLQTQQLMLSTFGLTALLIPSTKVVGTQQYQDLRIQKVASTPPDNSTKPRPAAPSVDSHGQISASPAPSLTPVASPTPAPAAPAAPQKEKLWYVGGGGTYKPGQAFSVFGLAQRSRLNFPFASSSISGQIGYPYGAVRSLNYSGDYIGFEHLHQRLSLRLTGSTDVETHRFILGQKVDEHRTGGFGQLMLEPFHDLSNSLLQLTAEVRRATVSEQNNVATVLKLNLSTVRVSGLYQFQTELSEHPRSFKLEPFVEIGLGLSATEPNFTFGGISANYHQAIGALAGDITGHFEESTASTPIVELPSFGGAEVMRGFRIDDAIGRRYWSLQNELWVPLPGLASAVSNTQLKTLLSQLRLAPFFDVGGAYQTVTSVAGLRLGPGAGLRFDMDRIVLKFDWAYGIGDSATGGSRGKFYFTLVSNLPL